MECTINMAEGMLRHYGRAVDEENNRTIIDNKARQLGGVPKFQYKIANDFSKEQDQPITKISSKQVNSMCRKEATILEFQLASSGDSEMLNVEC